jgi:tetratricopeptide (TPR) repeat protein
VVLYQLLAGEKPSSELEKPGPLIKASAMAVRSGKGQRWSRRLEGDLDNILQMAMRVEPERRYPTVERMRADLDRHLDGLPVSARRETWRYRCAKFLKRHPIGTPAAVMIALAAIAGVGFIARAERDAQMERHKAEQRLGQLVELANHTLFDVHDSIEKLPGATAARIQIVRTTVDYLDKLNAESGNDTQVLSALASAYVRVARVQGSPTQPNLGDLRGAEQSYVKAGKALDALMKRGAVDSDLRLRDAELRMEYGLLLADTGRKDEMIAQYKWGIEEVRTVLARDPRSLPAGKLSVGLHTAMSRARQNEDPAGARRDDMQQLPIAEAMVRDYPHDTDCLLNLASLWSHIGITFELEHRLTEAAGAFRSSTALRERLFAVRPQDVSVQHDLLIAYGHLGDVTGSPLFLTLGDYRGGVAWYQKALLIARQMATADPSNAQARSDEGTALMRIGTSQVASGEHRAALETLNRAEALLEPLRIASPASNPLVQNLATIYEYQSIALDALGEPKAASDGLRHGLSVCDAILKVRADLSCRHTTWTIHRLLAVTLAESGDIAGALAEAKSSLDVLGRPEDSRDTSLHAYLGRALAANGAVKMILAKRASGRERISDWRSAADDYRRALDEFGAFHPMVEPYLSDMRRAEANLAECERALKP